MIYKDRVYGEVEIEEDVILDLINCPFLQRLKGIDQAGYSKPYFPEYAFRTRFEHSVGVFILLRKFGACIEEQIAGLIHDVSHTVFSHCIDYALDEGSETKQDFQDNTFLNFVMNSEIPDILRKHSFDVEYILDEHNFPLLERPLPDLCADRLDYSLRAAVAFKEIDRLVLNYFLDNLFVEKNFWVFKDIESAEKYAQLFLKLDTLYFSNLSSGLMFKTVGELMRYALTKKYISKDDLYTTDKEVLKKIEKNLERDTELRLLWERMNNKVEFKKDSRDYDIHIFCKSRAVDPLCKYGNRILRLSEINREWKGVLERALKPKEYFIKWLE